MRRAPNSNASRTAPNFSSSRLGLALEGKLRASRSRRWIRTEPPPSSQPFRAMRTACPGAAAGSFGDTWTDPREGDQNSSSSGTTR